MEYNFKEIEAKWRQEWEKKKAYKTSDPGTPGADKPKYYVLDMFPYPSGAGLHVGHPLGYIASDIFARFKRLKGFNVLHPMGYDAFGLPAEQYAIETGQHPAVTTMKNIARYREQLDKIGFSFDWSREVRTSDPKFYKWTQWIFLKLFNSWYNPETGKAEAIDILIAAFGQKGYKGNPASSSSDRDSLPAFTGEEWKNFDEKTKSDILMNFRLAYLSEAWVNWCPKLGTVLANDEVKDGVSERGGYPVERKLMPQWSLRITAYADRLLNDLDTLDWPENIKEAQRNWIGRSEGAKLEFNIQHSTLKISVFTTRPDTIFGVSFLTLAPENELVMQITAPERKQQVEAYLNSVKSKSDRERQAEVKNVSGEFTGAYAIHPFTGKKIPVWVGDYVLSGYGTGAVMGVPAHDSRDHAFAKHFGLEIIPVIQAPTSPKGKINEGTFVASPIGGQGDSYDAKEGKCINSDFLNGLEVKDAIKRAIEEIESKGIGARRINYRLRDAAFGRQRYWGEPIPIYYRPQGGAQIPTPLSESELPLVLPEIDNFKPTVTGEPPLARAKDWKYKELYNYEYTTMPGWAGSSWYYLRYMDPSNAQEFASQQAINYWQSVDLYVGGAEHVTGHLLYVRFWTKFLHDLGYVPFIEPTKKLVNQGMILGESAFAKVLQVSWTLPWPGPDSLSCPNITPNKIPLIFIPIEFTTQYPDPNVGEISKELDKFIIEKLKKYNPDQLS
ncbi:MAG: leucine--tRNA ligase, partial [Bacteroidia bacterium]|nr:leucine--tRNA ligase [Bacteroidia bacterium]